MRVEFSIPGPVPSTANLREHWRGRQARTRRHRLASRALAQSYLGRSDGADLLALGGVVTLTRVSPRPLDSDNLASSLKAHRDGIADALGVDDGDPRIEWRYAQAKCGKGQQALLVVVETKAWSDPREVVWVGDDPVCWCGHSWRSHSMENRRCWALGCDCTKGYSAPVEARRPIQRERA